MRLTVVCSVALVCVPGVWPENLEPAGVLGNSGVSGARLVRVGPLPFDRSSTGVAVDADMTLWVSGGDRINRLSLDGSLVEWFPLEPAGSAVDSRVFAVVGGNLYFLARRPDGSMALYHLALEGDDDRRAAPVAVELPARPRDWMPYLLAPQPLDGRLVLASETEGNPVRLAVYLLDPAVPPPVLEPAFTVAGQYPGGLAVDAQRGVIYLGAEFPVASGADGFANSYAILALRPDGTPASPGFPVACTKTPAVPTQFRGFLSLAAGALWDTAWYGFLSRHDLDGRGNPGRVVEWHHDLGYPTQVVGLTAPDDGSWPGNQLLAVTCAQPDSLYLARWNESARALTLEYRLGCVPTIASLGLSGADLVTIGTARSQLWFRWTDLPTSPPVKAELHIPVTPPFFHEDRCFALAAQYRLDDLDKRAPVPTVFSPVVGNRNEAFRNGDPVPFRRPVGLSVRVIPGDPNATVFVTDAESRQIWQAPFWLPELKPAQDRWEPLPLAAALLAPTDVAALTDGDLLVADRGRVLLLAPQDGAYRVKNSWDRIGDGPQGALGAHLRMAVDGSWALLSDSDRHRIVLLDWTRWRPVAQWGETDVPGDDLHHLSCPQQVALRLPRAVVADAGNQRVVKLTVAP